MYIMEYAIKKRMASSYKLTTTHKSSWYILSFCLFGHVAFCEHRPWHSKCLVLTTGLPRNSCKFIIKTQNDDPKT